MRAGKLALGIWILIFAITGMILRAHCSPVDTIESYVEHIHGNMKPHYAANAKKMIPTLIFYSDKYHVDPLLVACIFYWESSWRNFSGAVGEIGPGHVKPAKWSRRFNLTTLDGQIEAAVYRWTMATNKCNGLEAAMSHYLSGKCKSESVTTQRKAAYRVRYYRAMKERF